MLRRAWTVSLVFVVSALGATAESAAAAPRMAIEEVVLGEEFGRGGRCFAPGSAVSVTGEGFVPGRTVRVARRRIRAGRDGSFGFLLRTSEPRRAQQRVTVRARQVTGKRGVRASLRYWSALPGVDVPGWNGRGPEAIAIPGKMERARLAGFDHAIGRPLYVHYVLDGQQVFSQRVARLRGPCGAADFRLVQFPFSPVPAGLYRVDFGTRPTVDLQLGAGYARVRVGTPPPPLPPITAPLFTVAGNGAIAAAPDGSAATASGLQTPARVSARRGGGFLVTDRGRVRAVDVLGRISTVAGTGRPGSSGDGGSAVAARVAPTAVAALADGGFLIGDCNEPNGLFGRVRRVGSDGVITTVAGTGRRGPSRDGMPATDASLMCPADVAPTPDGGFLIAEEEHVRAVGPDGILRTVAGSGQFPEGEVHGGPALRTPIEPDDVAVMPNGSVLISDRFACHVFRLANDRLTVVAGDGSEGRRSDEGARAVDASVCPRAAAPAPGGGFYVVDAGYSSLSGSEPRVRLVNADGRIVTVAGTGRFSPTPSRREELRGDGMPAPGADLLRVRDLAVLSDGGVVFTEGDFYLDGLPALVRYVPPESGGMLAVAVRRDRDRVFARGQPAFATVSLTAPAEVTVTVKDADTIVAAFTRQFPAGDTRVELPGLAGKPHVVVLAARDEAGRVAEDRAAILPRGYLSSPLARSIASAIASTATNNSFGIVPEVGRCRRIAASRVDCSLIPEVRCAAVVIVRLGVDRRLRWATYRCPIGSGRRTIMPLRRLRRSHYSCDISDTSCPPPLFRRVADRWLVPWD